jgi:hypothetical protein
MPSLLQAAAGIRGERYAGDVARFEIFRRRTVRMRCVEFPADVDGDDVRPLLRQPDRVVSALPRAAPVTNAILPSIRPIASSAQLRLGDRPKLWRRPCVAASR